MSDQPRSISYIEALHHYYNESGIENSNYTIDFTSDEITSANKPDLDLENDINNLDSTIKNHINASKRCNVCNSPISSTEYYKCRSCGRIAHKTCYTSPTPTKDCISCKNANVTCILCHTSGGLLLKSRYYYHPACLQYGLSYNPLTHTDVDKLIQEANSKESQETTGASENPHKSCISCSLNSSFTLQCGFPSCPFRIHIPCALSKPLGAVTTALGHGNSKFPWRSVFCPEHSNKSDFKTSAIFALKRNRIKNTPRTDSTCPYLSAAILISDVHFPPKCPTPYTVAKDINGDLNGNVTNNTTGNQPNMNNATENPNTTTNTTTTNTTTTNTTQSKISKKSSQPVFQSVHPFAKGSNRSDLTRRVPLGPAAARALALEPQSHHKKCLEEVRLLNRLLRPIPLQPPNVKGIEHILKILKSTIWSGLGSPPCRDIRPRLVVLLNSSLANDSGVMPKYTILVFIVQSNDNSKTYSDLLKSLAFYTRDMHNNPYLTQDDFNELEKFDNFTQKNSNLILETHIPLTEHEYSLACTGVLEFCRDPLNLRLLIPISESKIQPQKLSWQSILKAHGISKPQEPIPTPQPFPKLESHIDLAGYRWVFQGTNKSESEFVDEQLGIYKNALTFVRKEISQLRSSLYDSILKENCEPLRLSEIPSCRYLYTLSDSSDRWSLLLSNIKIMLKEDVKRWDDNNTSDSGKGIAVCSVCFYEGKTNLNPLITCARCGISFHRSCYGIGQPTGGSPYPNRDWNSGELICRRCEVEKKTLGTQWMNNFTRNSTLCSICLRGGGAFKTTTNGRWVHVFCGLALIPDAKPLDPSYLEPWELPQTPISPCRICGIPLGITIKCFKSDNYNCCDIACHPMCAWLQGFRFILNDDDLTPLFSDSIGSLFPPFKLDYYCSNHDPQWNVTAASAFRKSRYVNRDFDPAHNEARRKSRFRGTTRPSHDSRKADTAPTSARLSAPSYDAKTCAVCLNTLSRDREIGFPIDDFIDNSSWTRCGDCHVAVHLNCYMFEIAGTLGLSSRTLPNGITPFPTPIGRQNELIIRDDETRQRRWLCDVCTLGGDNSCCICGRRGLGLKAWAIKDPILFCHIICLIWHTEFAISLVKQTTHKDEDGIDLSNGNDAIGNVSNVSNTLLENTKSNDNCPICLTSTGILLKCSRPDCEIKFHASCGHHIGLVLHRGGESFIDLSKDCKSEQVLESMDLLDITNNLNVPVSLCPTHSEVSSRFAPSLFLFFRLKDSFNMTLELANDLRNRELMKRSWIRKRKQLLNAAFPLLDSNIAN